VTPDAASRRGRLVLVGTPIGNLGDLSPRAVEALTAADVIAAEDTRRARALLSHAGVEARGRVRAVHGHNEAQAAAALAGEVRAGRVVAYVSDAGMPGISDPGERLVRACIDDGSPVEVVPGPSAVLAALVVSGLPTARFRFEGFLPRKGLERRRRLDAVAASTDTVVLYESPHRIAATLRDLAQVCGDDRDAALVREVTKLHEEARRGALGELAAGVAADPPRGEMVVVVAPAAARTVLDDDALEAAAAGALTAETTARDAAARVATELGVSKRRAYEAVLRVRGAKSEGRRGAKP
jgi:16S rRNA (cytidine1402-2'-O)-methyltransferase